MKDFEVPIRPMFGMIGVAPPGLMSVDPNTLGPWGGNLDYNRIEEGATVFLPVLQPGALLYLGDVHAAQGDGEISGAGIETSADVEFTLDLLRGKQSTGPRIETPEHLIAVGVGGTLDVALEHATTELARWLAAEYSLTPAESALVLDQLVRFDVAEVVGRDRVIGARISRASISKLRREPK